MLLSHFDSRLELAFGPLSKVRHKGINVMSYMMSSSHFNATEYERTF